MDDADSNNNNNTINFQVPGSVRFILDTIRGAGYEAYIVGGCVRDRLLGREPDDWDITTSALPEQVKGLFSVTVDTGIQHGTVMVLRGGRGYEVTTYRVDGAYKDGRHPESVVFTPNLEEDLKRRDFTINAFAYDPESGIVDLFGGLDDLRGGIIRAVGDPDKRFDEDALRIMRAVRFSAQLSFGIEEKTRNAISAFAPKLALVSRERIRVEFEKTIYSDNPAYVNEYRRLGLAQYIVPELYGRCFLDESERLWEQIPADDEDVDVLRLAAFFMGLKSGECSTVMRKMTFDNRTRDLVSGILKYRSGSSETQGGCRDAVSGLSQSRDNAAEQADSLAEQFWDPAPISIRKALRICGAETYRLGLKFRKAQGLDVHESEKQFENILQRGEAYNISMLDITGADLMDAGIPQGKRIGETLNMLLDKVIEDPQLNNKEVLIKFI